MKQTAKNRKVSTPVVDALPRASAWTAASRRREESRERKSKRWDRNWKIPDNYRLIRTRRKNEMTQNSSFFHLAVSVLYSMFETGSCRRKRASGLVCHLLMADVRRDYRVSSRHKSLLISDAERERESERESERARAREHIHRRAQAHPHPLSCNDLLLS